MHAHAAHAPLAVVQRTPHCVSAPRQLRVVNLYSNSLFTITFYNLCKSPILRSQPHTLVHAGSALLITVCQYSAHSPVCERARTAARRICSTAIYYHIHSVSISARAATIHSCMR